MPVDLESDLRKWGNSLGLVIPASVAKQYRLKAGQHVRLRLEVDLPPNDPDRLPTWNWRWPYDIDEMVDEDIAQDLDRLCKARRK